MLVGLKEFKIKKIQMDLILELIQNFNFQMDKFMSEVGADLKQMVLD